MLEIDYYLCTDCGACVPVCHTAALRLTISGLEIEQELCDLCNICVKVCPTEALQIKKAEYEEV